MTRTFVKSKLGVEMALNHLSQASYTLNSIPYHPGHELTEFACHICIAKSNLDKAIRELRKTK